MAGERGIDPSMLEKDYVLGWILYGISESSIGQRLAFKGGTALSKVYYPGEWRFSEDLDFTALDSSEWDRTTDALGGEVPEKVRELSGMEIALRPKLHTNPRYLQARMRYVGPIGRGTAKVDITREGFLGSVEDVSVPAAFDCPEFTVRAHTVETILAEKMRSIIQRGHVRDYYDVWRLLGERPSRGVADMFVKKCRAAGVDYSGVEQFFPADIEENLKAYADIGLARLAAHDMPSVEEMLSELRASLERLLSA